MNTHNGRSVFSAKLPYEKIQQAQQRAGISDKVTTPVSGTTPPSLTHTTPTVGPRLTCAEVKQSKYGTSSALEESVTVDKKSTVAGVKVG